MNAIRVCWQWDQASQRNAVAGTREGHGNALGHGDRQTTRVPGSFFVQDATRLQLRVRDTDVQGLWFWPTQGFQHTQFRENC